MKKLLLLLFAFISQAYAIDSVNYSLKIKKLKSDNLWEIHYRFKQPVSQITFSTNPNSFREKSWDFIGKNLTLITKKGQQSLIFSKPTKSFKIKVNGLDNNFYNRNYTPFIVFSDMSSAIYVGHYYLSSVKIKQNLFHSNKLNLNLQLSTNMREKILYKNKISSNKIKMRKETNPEYAYFGNLGPSRQKYNTLIIDPKLPKWIISVYEDSTPKIISFFQTSFNIPLPSVPLVLVGFNNKDISPRIDGGFIGNQVAINIVGNGWSQYNLQNKNEHLRLLTHEISHLWIGGLFKANTKFEKFNNVIWMHEGGANAFALKALLELKLVSKDWFNSQYEKAINKCINSLYFSNINSFDKVDKLQSSYPCGASLNLLFEQMLNDKNIFVLWANIFLAHSNNVYSQYDILTTLQQSLVPEAILNLMKTALNGNKSLLNPQDSYQKLFENYGFSFDSTLSKSDKKYQGKLALQNLMQSMCGRTSFWTEKGYYKTEALPSCHFFEKELKIQGFNDLNLFSDGDKAYAYLYEKCKYNKEIKINLYPDKLIFKQCNKNIKAMQKLKKIKAFPNFLYRDLKSNNTETHVIND